MLQLRLLDFSIIVFMLQKSVVAFPHLGTRDLDNIFNIDWGKVGAGLFTGLGAWGTYLNLQQSGPQEQDTTTTKNPNAKTVPGPAPPGTMSTTEPNYELGTPPKIPDGPIWEPSVPSSQCDTHNIFSIDCGKVLDQLIFTTGCKKIAKGQVPTATAVAQNAAILALLNTMAPGRVRTCKSSQCDVFMFMAPLTKQQSDQVENTPGVSHVSPNIFFDTQDESAEEPQPDPAGIEPANKRRKLRKRDIVRQANAPAHLQFISTPEGYPGISTDYVYDDTAGDNTVVFPLGPGLTMNHDEFRNNPVALDDFIFAADVPTASTLLFRSFGTCLGSLVMGEDYGVSKKTKLKPVRIQSNVGSLISAMLQIGQYIQVRIDLGQPANGYVMHMDMAWQNTEPATTEEFEKVFELLLYDYDVVTVVAAGTDTAGTNAPINSYPALYAAETPVISVGGVDMSGEVFTWSRGGTLALPELLTLTAPGSVACASNQGGSAIMPLVTGTAIAAAQAAALAAYYLTLYPQLRADQNPVKGAALAVKEFMVQHAYARLPGGEISIWNLMGPDTSPTGIGGNSAY
ncbi:hypothetical protein MMC22_002374 [Lobaria immixta]|nr:hypothetical protein [Lobaria immixta]